MKASSRRGLFGLLAASPLALVAPASAKEGGATKLVVEFDVSAVNDALSRAHAVVRKEAERAVETVAPRFAAERGGDWR